MRIVVQSSPDITPCVACSAAQSVVAGALNSLEGETILGSPGEVLLQFLVTNLTDRRAWLDRLAGWGWIVSARSNQQVYAIEPLVALRSPVMDSPALGIDGVDIVHV